jgi:hypothetical protein
MEGIVKRSRERGIDVEDVLIAALAEQDPQEGVKLRISLAERYMAEREKYLREIPSRPRRGPIRRLRRWSRPLPRSSALRSSRRP